MKLPFATGTYQRADDRLPQARLINQFVEKSPTSVTGTVLMPRPGLRSYLTLPGSCRGLYKQSGVLAGALLSVFGQQLYREDESLGAVTGSDLVQWTYTEAGLRVLAGGRIYDVANMAVDSFNGLASSLTSVNSILLASKAESGQIYYRLPGDTVWSALDYTSAEAEPDDLVGLMTTRGEVWAFGYTSIEILYPTDQINQPLRRADGRQIQRGCRFRDAIAKLDNTLFWVGDDNNVYRAAEVPEIISNPGIAERVSASTTGAAWTYSLDGHQFYVLNLDSETLAYDVSTGEWHQLRLYGQDGFVITGLSDGSTTYVASETIWTLDRTASDDAGQPLERIFTSYAVTEKPVSADALEVLLSPGSAPSGVSAVIETRWSRDQGRTWSGWREAATGAEGEYRTRARIRRLGMIDAPGTVYEHRITDAAPLRISGVELNPPLGGRSR